MVADAVQRSGPGRFDSVSIAALRSFAAMAETGSFSAASRQLRLVVSTISKHVDTLEARLQTALVLRTTRRITLTDAGADFYDHCRAILDRLDSIADQSRGPREVRGRLRVVGPPSFTTYILAPALPEFLERHPALHVELRVTTASVDFLRDGVDVSLRTMPSPGTADQVEQLGSAKSLLCASPAYLARFGTPYRPGDLRSHRCFSGIKSPYSELWRFAVDGKAVEMPIQSVFSSDTGDVLRNACLKGLGIAGFYEFHVAEDLQAGRLVQVLGDCRADDGYVYAVRPAARYSPLSTSLFISFVRQVLARQGMALADDRPMKGG